MAQNTSLRGAKVAQGGQNISRGAAAPSAPYFPRLWSVSVIPLQHRTVLFVVFGHAGPPRRVGCLAQRWHLGIFLRTQRRAIASVVEPRFRYLSITSPALYHLSCTSAAISYYQSSQRERYPVKCLAQRHKLTCRFVLHIISLNAERQTGKLRIPTFEVLWFYSTWESNPGSTDCEANAPATKPRAGLSGQ